MKATGHEPQAKEDDNRMVIARTQDTLKPDIAITSQAQSNTASLSKASDMAHSEVAKELH